MDAIIEGGEAEVVDMAALEIDGVVEMDEAVARALGIDEAGPGDLEA